ncbi:hypothetical protein C8P63_11734 [Melghirimyces profundicolus]|uniref:Uncharacterized protein n=1 Tax=Melghirimyces profundicolus TaxID=1242148 RepID=A0A2T6BQP0_9BACL|nr:hypothetical protein [Melghirimyces profundicolus]PTX58287.1 hypothetical protein C8P63_11734 [Melghirimyces profundicolus]
MFDTKKGKYTAQENERIIQKINEGLEQGVREREILKELSAELNRGFAGVMSHVRKLRSQFPEHFKPGIGSDRGNGERRLNSWTEEEENTVIETVNRFLAQGKPLSSAISQLEKELNRTQGAIYQRIYTLRRKTPERFHRTPGPRPRRHSISGWQVQRPEIRDLEEIRRRELELAGHETAAAAESSGTANLPSKEGSHSTANLSEEDLVLMAFESQYGKPGPTIRRRLTDLMRKYGHTRVSIALFTLHEDKEFPSVITRFLENHLKRNSPVNEKKAGS